MGERRRVWDTVGVPVADEPATLRLWAVPRLAADDRMVAGVAAGIADEVGLDPMVVRVSFAVLAVAGGWGVVLYGVAWVLMSLRPTEVAVETRAAKGRTRTHRLEIGRAHV